VLVAAEGGVSLGAGCDGATYVESTSAHTLEIVWRARSSSISKNSWPNLPLRCLGKRSKTKRSARPQSTVRCSKRHL